MKRIRKGIITVKEFEYKFKKPILKNIDTSKITENSKETKVLDEKVFTLSDRYKTFIVKGYICVCCGIKGEYFALERGMGCAKHRYHLNLYGKKDEKEILMTKDHIIPKSLGGKNHISNYQTMCESCNSRKGNTIRKDE